MTPNVAKKAIGMPSATHIAVFQARNTNKTIKTIINPEIPFLTNKDIPVSYTHLRAHET